MKKGKNVNEDEKEKNKMKTKWNKITWNKLKGNWKIGNQIDGIALYDSITSIPFHEYNDEEIFVMESFWFHSSSLWFDVAFNSKLF